ncbi:MOSC domain-containing protein [Bowmanella pacifica]|uniref:MOSC domain-containing protein n=1 Tax=Bowmanella pacifica TaxID=502051 RepID=A0A917YU15_9ALTE|nr:MOSC domain-containing protein [Bowmanella pacifica]GGO66559.1 hypothetical protein GCM10010982_11030 [Bowmanella pacifica]
MARLADIYIYPIKSTQGIALSHSWVERPGLSFDRRFMLADSKGRMLTGRALPRLIQVSAVLRRDGLMVCHADMPALFVRYSDCAMTPVATQVWKDQFEAFATTEAANRWFSLLLGRECQLLYCGEHTPRFSAKADVDVSFADGFPLLLISQASLQELNRRSPLVHQMAQFRPNLVVEDTLAFAEDSWQRIRIGEVEFKLDSPCSRCVFTTRDPRTGEFLGDQEPLKTLGTFRKDRSGKINFGMNLIPVNEGRLEVGMPVEVLQADKK